VDPLVSATGYGKIIAPDTGNAYQAPCKYSAAVSCDTGDYSRSTFCKPGAYPIKTIPGSCYFPTDDSLRRSGYGWQLPLIPGGGEFRKCYSPYCLTCGADFGVCVECEPNAILYNYKCIYFNAAPSSFIGNTVMSTSATISNGCSTQNCYICATGDIMGCGVCKNSRNTPGSLDYTQTAGGSACGTFDEQSNGWGVDPVSFISRSCQDQNCYKCQNDYKFCTECKLFDIEGEKVFMVEGMGICTSVRSEMMVGWGVITEAYPVRKYAMCTSATTDCKLCIQDYTVKDCTGLSDATTVTPIIVNCKKSLVQSAGNFCVECDDGFYTNPFQANGCYPAPGERSKQGLAVSSAQTIISPCKDPRCLSCMTDYASCTYCEPPYIASAGVCSLGSIQNSGFDFTSNPLVVNTCTMPGCNSCFGNNAICDTPILKPL